MSALLADRRALLAAPDVTIGDVLRRIRRVGDWSQQDLADALGATQDEVKGWEQGRSIPPALMLDCIHRVGASGRAPVSLPTLVWLWWREHALTEDEAERATGRAKAAERRKYEARKARKAQGETA